MNPGDPTTRPVCVSALPSTAREMPIMNGRRPVLGQQHVGRFQVAADCDAAAWIAVLRPAAEAPGQHQHRGGGQRPVVLLTAFASAGPRHVRAVASHGTGLSTSASITGAEISALTRRATPPPGTRPELGVLGQVGLDHLHRHRPAAGRSTSRPTRPMPPAWSRSARAGTARSARGSPGWKSPHHDCPRPSSGRSGTCRR